MEGFGGCIFVFPLFVGIDVNHEAGSVQVAGVWVLGTPSRLSLGILQASCCRNASGVTALPRRASEDLLTLSTPKHVSACVSSALALPGGALLGGSSLSCVFLGANPIPWVVAVWETYCGRWETSVRATVDSLDIPWL